MVLLEKFCCCLGLQTGGIIIGWLSVILGIISFGFKELIDGIIIICVGIIFISSGASLIWGAYKKRKLFIIPWLVSGILGIISKSLIFAVQNYILIYHNQFSLEIFGADIIGIVLSIYSWLCIVSLYQKFRFEDLQQTQNSQQYVVFSAISPVEDTADVHPVEEK